MDQLERRVEPHDFSRDRWGPEESTSAPILSNLSLTSSPWKILDSPRNVMYISGQVKTRLAGVHDGRHDPHIWSFLTADQFHKLQRKCCEGYLTLCLQLVKLWRCLKCSVTRTVYLMKCVPYCTDQKHNMALHFL